MGMKTTKITKISIQNDNKGRPNSKFRSWNKKNNNKTTTCAKQKSNKIQLQKGYKTRLWQENVSKTNVEQTKSNGELYFYLYPLGI